MAETPRYRELVETPEYTAQLEHLAQTYSDGVIEPILQGIFWGMATNPRAYDRVTGSMWEARSRSFNELDPRFRIFFGLPNEAQVLLLWIEEIRDIDELDDSLM